MGKSYENFAPTGPVLVTGDDLDPANLRVTTILHSGATATTMQDSRTDQLIFGIPELIARLSQTVELRVKHTAHNRGGGRMRRSG
jgi:2,4-diketo-3-deoxy-L-fuconate hydrolase